MLHFGVMEERRPHQLYDKDWFRQRGRTMLSKQIVPVLISDGITVERAQDLTDGQWLSLACRAGVGSAINRNKIPSDGTRQQVIARLAGHYARHGAPTA